MKRYIVITVLISLIVFMGFPICADDIIINEDTALEDFSGDDYIPQEIYEILEAYGAENSESLDTDELLYAVKNEFIRAFSGYSRVLSSILGILFFSALIKRIINNERFIMTFNYISLLAQIVFVFEVFSDILQKSENILDSLAEVLSVVLPSLCAVLAVSGCTFSILTTTASFGVILSFINNVISRFIAPCICVLLVIMLFEKLTNYLSDIGIFRFTKNTIMNTIKFITTLLISVMSFQSLLAASKDSVSMRAVRFAAANFIPIVGSVVSESARTISAGMKLMRTSVGGSCILAVFLVVLPVLVEVLFLKIVFGIYSMVGGMLGAVSEKSLFDSASDILDILNGMIVFTMIISVIGIILFITAGYMTFS